MSCIISHLYNFRYANLIWDHFVFLLFTLTTMLLLAVFSLSEFTGQSGLALFLLMVVFSFSSLPITHLLTTLVGYLSQFSWLDNRTNFSTDVCSCFITNLVFEFYLKWIQSVTYSPCLKVKIFSYIYWNLLQIDSPALCFAVICTAGFSSGVCGIMLSIYIDSPHLHSALALIPYSALGIGEKTVSVTTGLPFLSVICRQSKTVRACLHLLSDSDLSNYVNNWKHHSVVCPSVIYPQVSLICIRTKISRVSTNYAIV